MKKENIHYGMKKPNRAEGFNSFAIGNINFILPIDKDDCLYTEDDLKLAFTEGFKARCKMLNSTESRDNFIEQFKNNKP